MILLGGVVYYYYFGIRISRLLRPPRSLFKIKIGHNLGYAHSNEDGDYKDQSCAMGYGYGQDDGPIMCFNGAKSWQTGWYAPKSKVISPDPGVLFTANLYGIANYDNSASSYVLFKINNASTTDIYVTYNRKSGINPGNMEAANITKPDMDCIKLEIATLKFGE